MLIHEKFNGLEKAIKDNQNPLESLRTETNVTLTITDIWAFV
jgi:hypothetical protein